MQLTDNVKVNFVSFKFHVVLPIIKTNIFVVYYRKQYRGLYPTKHRNMRARLYSLLLFLDSIT